MTLTNMHSTSDLCIVTSLYESAFWGIVNYCFMHVPVHEQLVNPSKKTDIDDVCLCCAAYNVVQARVRSQVL